VSEKFDFVKNWPGISSLWLCKWL